MKFKEGQIIKIFEAKNGKEVTLRTARMKDLDQLLSFINSLIEEDTFILQTSKKNKKEERGWLRGYLKRMKNGEGVLIVAEIDRRIVGCADLKIPSERSRHFGELGLSVLKDFRNLGIGTKMMEILVELGKKIGFKFLILGVFSNNRIAIKLYKKFGFREVARIPKMILYKGNYFDDIQMIKKL